MTRRLAHHAAGLALAGLIFGAAAPDVLATPVSYVDVGVGDFGSMAWAGWASMGSHAEYAGGPARLSAQSSWSHPRDTEYGRASSSMLFGDLHALADAGSCSNSGPEDACGPFRTTIFAGAAIWDTLRFEGGEAGQLIRPRLHIDGVSMGAAYGRVRHYVGLSDDPVGALNRLPGQGWTILSGNVDLEVDLADIVLGFPWGWTVFIELDVSAREGFGGNVADFGNTARFQWELPQGVRYTSASGQFMTGVNSVPTAGALALASLGLLVAAAVKRQRARGRRAANDGSSCRLAMPGRPAAAPAGQPLTQVVGEALGGR